MLKWNFLNDQISTWQVMMVAKVLGPKDLATYEKICNWGMWI
jgi:hypothetical protein